MIALLLSAALASPEALFTAHPDDAAKRVEYFLEKPAGKAPWPAVVLLHGHQDPPSAGGRVMFGSGAMGHLASLGYLAVAVSLPGYGGSDGPSDFAGPFAQHAVQGVVRELQRTGLATGRVALMGASLGAMTSGLIAAHDRSISGCVLVSGEWDLVDAAEHGSLLQKKLAANMVAHVKGGDALRDRSLVNFADQVKAPVLVLAGAKDDRTLPEHGRKLVDAINAHGGHARLIVYPDLGHRIPPEARDQDVDPFLASILKK
jgi:dipeptidyl aminopeptidase/acylaminoacyl peptidase